MRTVADALENTIQSTLSALSSRQRFPKQISGFVDSCLEILVLVMNEKNPAYLLNCGDETKETDPDVTESDDHDQIHRIFRHVSEVFLRKDGPGIVVASLTDSNIEHLSYFWNLLVLFEALIRIPTISSHRRFLLVLEELYRNFSTAMVRLPNVKTVEVKHIEQNLKKFTDVFLFKWPARADDILLKRDVMFVDAAFSLLKSGFLVKRVLGLEMMESLMKQDNFPFQERSKVSVWAELMSKNIIDELFGDNLHVYLMRRATFILRSLAQRDRKSVV